MSDENRNLNKKDQKRLDEGRGQGSLDTYKPFILVGECSRPNYHRTFCQIIHRTIWQHSGYFPKFSSYDIDGLPNLNHNFYQTSS